MSDSRKSGGDTGPRRLRSRQRRKICHTLMQLYGDRCYYCTRSFGGTRNRQRTLDHLTPLSRGGTHEVENLVLSCSKCNGIKGDRDWLEYCQSPEFARRRQEGMLEKPEPPPKHWVEIIRSLRIT